MNSTKTASLFVSLWLAALAGILALSGCGEKTQKAAAPSGSQQPLEIKLAAFQLYASAIIVAADQSAQVIPGTDCFAEAGLKSTILKRSKGPEIVDALVSGSVHFGTLAITPVVFQVLQGSDFVIFATIQTTDHDIKLVGRRSAGVTSGSSLKSKRVGYVGGTWGEIFLNRYLEKHALKNSEVSLTSSGPAQLRDLFLAKSLDAIIVWEPVIQDILADPAVDKGDVFVDVDRSLYTGRINLVARPEVLTQKRAEALRLVKAMICGEKVLHEQPDKVCERLEAWLDRKPGTLAGVFDKDTFKVELDVPSLIRDLQSESEWAKDAVFQGKATIPKDFSRFVDASVMQEVAPDRVKK